jgi:hypothetical protein
MKRLLVFVFLAIFIMILPGRMDSGSYATAQQYASGESTNVKINIYPVPVRNNSFTIKTDRDIAFVKVTNILGQDILRVKYNEPQQLIKISLDSPQRGMYLVTVIFTDGARIVKKIMIEESE